jgi:hypothetical protein
MLLPKRLEDRQGRYGFAGPCRCNQLESRLRMIPELIDDIPLPAEKGIYCFRVHDSASMSHRNE